MDVIYGFSPYEIEKKSPKDLKITIKKLNNTADHYQWNFFKDIADYERKCRRAYKKFIADFKENGHR